MRPSLLTDQLMRNRNLILRHFSRGLDLPQIDGAVYTFYLFLVSPHTPLTSSTMCNPNTIAGKLTVEHTTAPKPVPNKEGLAFGKTFSDHMLHVDWDCKNGWHAPVIKPFGDMAVSPAAMCLHYAVECFEGMKAYKDQQGKIRLFRPDCNMERLNKSMERLYLPQFEPDALISCIKMY